MWKALSEIKFDILSNGRMAYEGHYVGIFHLKWRNALSILELFHLFFIVAFILWASRSFCREKQSNVTLHLTEIIWMDEFVAIIYQMTTNLLYIKRCTKVINESQLKEGHLLSTAIVSQLKFNQLLMAFQCIKVNESFNFKAKNIRRQKSSKWSVTKDVDLSFVFSVWE